MKNDRNKVKITVICKDAAMVSKHTFKLIDSAVIREIDDK